MSTLDKCGLIVIDPDEITSSNVHYMLVRSLDGVAIINSKCLCSKSEEIRQIMNDALFLKMFYGCSKEEYDKFVESFTKKAGQVFYLGRRLCFSDVAICYWKNKGFNQFSPTLVSSRQGLEIL